MNTKETHLQQSLAQLRTRLLVMSASVGIALDEACSALQSANLGKACAVVDGDDVINALENEIDDLALSILVRYQPVALDLRFVVAALRMVIDLERIGDEAANIAELTITGHDELTAPIVDTLADLLHTARHNYHQAAQAFGVLDSRKALALCRSDDECTLREIKALELIMDYTREAASSGQQSVSLSSRHGILLCRSLNRICRRTANIAEQVYFIAEGVNIKHLPVKAD